MPLDQYNKYKNKILAYYAASRRMPSYDEIRTLMGFNSKSAAYYLADKFVKEGFIQRDSKGKLIGVFKYQLPFIGTVHAGKTIGFPNPSEEETADTMDLTDLLQIDMVSSKLFRVQGDSMIEAGILNDDILLVECTDKWKVGDIVIAEVDGEETVKYARRTKAGKIYLEAANALVKNIYPQEYIKIKAVVKNVIRSF